MLVLEVMSHVDNKKRFWLQPGQKAVVGRSEMADFPFCCDHRMASRHFEIEGRSKGWRIHDLTSEYGTYLNGEPVQNADLCHMDQIVAGNTKLLIHLGAQSFRRPAAAGDGQVKSASAQRPTVTHFGSWTVSDVPPEWSVTDESGLQSTHAGPFPSSIVFGESLVSDHTVLSDHLELLVHYLASESSIDRVDGPRRLDGFGDRDLLEVVVTHKESGGIQLVQRQIHTRQHSSLGAMSLLTTMDSLDETSAQFADILGAARFDPKPLNADTSGEQPQRS